MHNYADQHGSLPAAAIYSADGKPLLSWRVALLPFIEQQALYDEFKLDEPWGSPHNRTLLDKMPSVYQHFHGRKAPDGHSTYYRVFVGPGAAFEGPVGVSLKDFPNGTSNTFLIVEAADAVPWTKPEELEFAPSTSLPALGGHFPDVFLAAFADGMVQTISRNDSDQVRARLLRK